MARDREAALAARPPLAIDPDALLVALVLVPESYPRNRFFALFNPRELFAVRRRAAMIRSLVGDLVRDADEVQVARDGEGITLRYVLREVGAARTTRLDEEELALVELTVARVRPGLELGSSDGARQRVMARLERLLPRA
jgi:hypothetical protein